METLTGVLYVMLAYILAFVNAIAYDTQMSVMATFLILLALRKLYVLHRGDWKQERRFLHFCRIIGPALYIAAFLYALIIGHLW